MVLLAENLSDGNFAAQKIASQWLALFFLIPFAFLKNARILVSRAIGKNSDSKL